MSPSDQSDHELADRLARLGNGNPVGPGQFRMMGGYCLFAAAFLGGVNVYSWTKGELWPKALVLAPSALLLGSWLLFDAKALSAGTRRHQKPILWGCIGIGSALGLAILHTLTGSFF
jgi:hypothetical protein